VADKGTLFLDEIGELPLELQPKLLRALEDQEFEKLGSSRPVRVNIRLITATNRDLAQLVRDRHFRADLYHRLNVFPIHLPPLRERSEDIPALVHHFVRQLSRRLNKPIRSVPKEVMDALKQYDWPGNIRELANFLERAVILSEGAVLCAPLSELQPQPASPTANLTLAEAERAHILEAIRQTNGVIAGDEGAAARLGLPRTTLIYRMRKLGIARGRRSRPAGGRSDTVVQFPERPARNGNGGAPHGAA
jgi:formate hydrogenlyase transcriptional activator